MDGVSIHIFPFGWLLISLFALAVITLVGWMLFWK
jgi:hypothetical protein